MCCIPTPPTPPPTTQPIELLQTVVKVNLFPLCASLCTRVKNVQTIEELRDVYQHFLLYYGHEIPAMRNAEKQQKVRERAERGADEEQAAEEEDHHDNLMKQATRRSGYSICLNARLGQWAGGDEVLIQSSWLCRWAGGDRALIQSSWLCRWAGGDGALIQSSWLCRWAGGEGR